MWKLFSTRLFVAHRKAHDWIFKAQQPLMLYLTTNVNKLKTVGYSTYVEVTENV